MVKKFWRKFWKLCPDCGHGTFEDNGRQICWPCINRQMLMIELEL